MNKRLLDKKKKKMTMAGKDQYLKCIKTTNKLKEGKHQKNGQKFKQKIYTKGILFSEFT